jgi:hypothetical protein
MIADPVDEPTLRQLELTAEDYEPQFNVKYCEDVEAYITTFVHAEDSGDSVTYMFNSKESAENMLLKLIGEEL